MTTHPYLHHGLTILRARLKTPRPRFPLPPGQVPPPFVTLSRETCAGATSVGRLLVPLLNARFGSEERSWMFLDKDLIQQALNHHHLPENLATFLPEDRLPEIQGLIGEIVGLHPPLWELEHRVAEAIHKFAQLGHVILSGRAAHLITRDLPGGLHVRLVAPLEVRIARAQELHQTGRKTAETFIRESDSARERHVRTNFDQQIDDPHTYDLVINTGGIPVTATANLVLQALQARVAALSPVH